MKRVTKPQSVESLQQEDPRFKKVKVIVFDADRFEIWREWHQRVTFTDDNMGKSIHYANLGNKPCWAAVYFSHVEGVYTAFVDACGAYADHKKLEEFMYAACNMKPTPDNQTNQTNFHNHPAWHTMNRKLRFQRLVTEAQEQIKEATNNLVRYNRELLA